MKTIKLIFFLFAIFFTSSTYADNIYKARKEEYNERRTLIIVENYWYPYNCLPDSEHPRYLIELI